MLPDPRACSQGSLKVLLLLAVCLLFATVANARVRPHVTPKPRPHVIQGNYANQTIWDILSCNPNLHFMSRAMTVAGFKELLSGLEPTITLFAPDNHAFLRLSHELKEYFLNETNLEVMTGVGLYHVRFRQTMRLVLNSWRWGVCVCVCVCVDGSWHIFIDHDGGWDDSHVHLWPTPATLRSPID